MKRHIDLLQKCLLFRNIEKENIFALLGCIEGQIKQYSKGQFLYEENKDAKISGIVLKGSLQIVQYDYYGNRSILSRIEEMQLFGESYSLVEQVFPANIVAAEDCMVLLFNTNKISSPCNNCCTFHLDLTKNLLKIMAINNVSLNQKLQCLSKRTTKDKLLNYLYFESKKNNNKEFVIPYDRQALADYLCVERSAMSSEISKLRDEGVLESYKNNFKLI